MVLPAGTFIMGSPPREPGRLDTEGPRHRVTIARPFAVGKYEVTFAEWDACVSAGGCFYVPHDGSVGLAPALAAASVR
jgi:formylglycine-generating enzyme required for sulfatase activity